MKRRTWKVVKRNQWWGIGGALLASLTASAGFGPVCVNCQLPSASPLNALGLDSQIPGLVAVDSGAGLGPAFGKFHPATGLVPAQSAIRFPNLLNLSGGAIPPPTPTWTEQVASGFLPADFSLAPKPLVDSQSITWNWGSSSMLGVFNPGAAMTSLWSGSAAPWAHAAQFWSGLPVAVPQVATVSGTAR